jgi:hypothetical protein
MKNVSKAVLQAGESLSKESLVSPNGAYALEHRTDGTLVLWDNRAGRNVWQIGTPVSSPGRLILVRQGFLVLEAPVGIAVWSSGGVDHRVVSAVIKDDGRLVLMDPIGHVRWSQDPLSAHELAAYRPPSGDRLQRGEVLADSIVSPDGRYTLTHTSAGETLLQTTSHDGRTRHVWVRTVGEPGAALSLGPDGVLRAGANSTVLQRWTGRYSLDPMSFTVSAVIVRNEGDVVLLSEDGTEIYNSGTSAEEARLAKLDREYARLEATENAKKAFGSKTGTDSKIDFPEDDSLLIRTDFSDDDAWRAVCQAACALDPDGFQAQLGLVDDRQLDGAAVEALLELVDREYFFVADTRTIANPEHAILVVNNVDPFEDDDPEFTVARGETFRVIPSKVWGPQNNLEAANMDFVEFASSTDDDGVFRGFS